MSMATPKSRAPSTPSSILKKPKSLTSRLSEINHSATKVRFILPHSQRVQSVLEDYARTKISRDYENLVCLIRDAELTDDELSELLKEATECISILNEEFRLFVEALLSVNWTDRNSKVVKKYHSFVVNLLSAHNYHARIVIDKLVKLFIPDITELEWPEGIPSDHDTKKCNNLHTLVNLLLVVVPMCKKVLMSSITYQFPYYNKSTHIHEYFLYNLLRLLDYQPYFKCDILKLIFSKLVVLDVNAPREDIQKSNEDEEMFEMDDDAKSVITTTTAFTQVNRNSVAHTLDVCLDQMFNYVRSECHIFGSAELDLEKTLKLYWDIQTVFDEIILPTYNTHHVQYIMFLMCSFKKTVAKTFLKYLWKKVCNPNEAPVLRQAAVNYIASLVARSRCIPLSIVKEIVKDMAHWVDTYIFNQDGQKCVNSDVRVHLVFYSICQALFYIVCFRHKDFVGSKSNMGFLASLCVQKMVNCRLNPLRVCQPAVVQKFASIMRKYQLAYCYTIIEENTKYRLQTIYQDEKGAVITSNNILDAFYPFDPYLLERSGIKIEPLYREYQEIEDMEVDSQGTTESKDTEVDDFLYISPSGSKTGKFLYGSSPGFKFKI